MGRRVYTIADLPERYRKQVLGQVKDDKLLDVPAVRVKRESKLQQECEKYLEFRGYRRLTQRNLEAGAPPRGWFAHIHEARGNPIFLDLLVLSNEAPHRWLMVELKTPAGRLAKHQSAMLAVCHSAALARSLDEFRRILTAWEQVTRKGIVSELPL